MRGKTAIHNKVATIVALEVNGVVERVFTSTKGAGRHGGYGYPDVIVVSSNLVWEIKPYTPYGRATGAQQIKRYIDAGRQPGYPVDIDPFPAILNGKEGTVYVINGCTPLDYGVVYYDFREYEEKRETVSEPVQFPVVTPAKEREDSRRKSNTVTAGALTVAVIAFVIAVANPIPGDGVAAGMALAAMLR